jgi:hypothetical protein
MSEELQQKLQALGFRPRPKTLARYATNVPLVCVEGPDNDLTLVVTVQTKEGGLLRVRGRRFELDGPFPAHQEVAWRIIAELEGEEAAE